MTTLRIANDYSYLQTTDEALKEKLWKSLRFKQRNYFHTSLYKQRLWDGYIDFFHKSKATFLTGLIPEVKLALHHLGVDYDIEDQRTVVMPRYTNVDDQFLNQWLPEGMKPLTLEDYQVEFINMALEHRRGIVKAPTSAGKAQPLDSLVATPNGFRSMGNIHVGDMVCVPSGGYAKVTGVFPQGIKPIIKITFSNGDTVE